jgi:hypothetical protein
MTAEGANATSARRLPQCRRDSSTRPRCGAVAKALDFPAKFDDNLPII